MSDATDHATDPAWDRLRDADPAAGDATDLSALRARVMAEVAAEQEPPTAGTPGPTATGGRRALAVAAAVALLAGVGLAAGAVGRMTAAPPRTVASGYVMPALNAPPGAGAPESTAAASGSSGPAAPVPDAARSSMPWFGGRTLLTPAPGLPDDPGTASGYVLDGRDVDARSAVQRLAEALGVAGQPRQQDGSWVVGPADGTAATVVVTADGLTSWWFDDPTASPWGCPAPAEPVPGPQPDAVADGEPGDAATVEPAPVPACPAVTGEPPSERAAERRAREVLRAVGGDPDAWAWQTTAESSDAGGVVTVSATRQVAGQSTGMSLSAQVGPAGLFAMSGFLATVEEVPGYPVVGARTAALRSLDPRWSTLGPTPVYREGDPVPLAASDDGAAVSGSSGAATAPPPAPTVDGRPVLLATVDEVTVTQATSDLTQFWQPDGTLLLVPAYLFTADDGRAWSMVAVADEYVSFTPIQASGSEAR